MRGSSTALSDSAAGTVRRGIRKVKTGVKVVAMRARIRGSDRPGARSARATWYPEGGGVRGELPVLGTEVLQDHQGLGAGSGW